MRTFFCFLSIIVLGTGTVYAQPSPPGQPGPPLMHRVFEPPPHPMMGQETHEKMMMFRMWRLIDTLDLNEDQAVKFFPLANRYFDGERQMNERRGRAADSLREAIHKDDVSEKDLKEKIDALSKVEEDRTSLREKYFKEATAILSPRQQAQLLLFEDRFQGEIRGMMQELRQQREAKWKERREDREEREKSPQKGKKREKK